MGHTTVDKTYNVPVVVKGAVASSHMAAKHPKNPDVGEKKVWTGPDLIIDGVDAEQLKIGENATFINWGNLMIKAVNKGSDGKVKSVEAEQNTDNKDFKKTLKLTWLCNDKENSPATPTVLIYYDHIISKAILEKDDDFKNFVNTKTKHEVEMLGDPELKDLKKGDCVQIQRRGYFICDVPYAPYSQSVGRARPCVLLAIPDGTPTSYGLPGTTVKPAPIAAKGTKESKKGEQKKADYKAATGSDWKPGAAPAPAPGSASATAGGDLGAAVAAQGDLVRKLKAEKAAKPDVNEAVKKL